jgi:HSP20 family protein
LPPGRERFERAEELFNQVGLPRCGAARVSAGGICIHVNNVKRCAAGTPARTAQRAIPTCKRCQFLGKNLLAETASRSHVLFVGTRKCSEALDRSAASRSGRRTRTACDELFANIKIFVMNTLTRWDPFKEMDELHDRISRLWGLRPTRAPEGGREMMTVTAWAPSVDIIEDEKEWLIKADLPDVKKEDVKVTVEGGVLSISGERKFEKEEKEKKYHRVERSYGSFMRSFTLPDGANGGKVSAEFKDGVLKVHLPKDEAAKPKAVDVKVA